MRLNNNHQAFMALVRAGLWEKEVRLLPYGELDFNAIYKLAQEQSVVGLLAAGLEHVKDVKVPQALALIIAGEVLQLEQRNRAMNEFIVRLIKILLENDIYALLVKGQGVAQCYERPLWRACGDVDLLLDIDNYEKAKASLIPLAINVEKESGKHIGLIIDDWVVELQGNLNTGLSKRLDNEISRVQNNLFTATKSLRYWKNDNVEVNLPDANSDIVFIFTHFLKHFYKGGLGMRQVCDWCRLLYTYRESLNHGLLESRIRKMGLMTEWKVFDSLAVQYLGMSVDAMPLYDSAPKWQNKADRLLAFVLETGNFGHNRDNSYYAKYSFLIRKFYSFGRRCGDLIRHARIFPLDSLRFFPYMMINGVKAAIKGIG